MPIAQSGHTICAIGIWGFLFWLHCNLNETQNRPELECLFVMLQNRTGDTALRHSGA